MKPVCVIGEGAWGTALATVLADNGVPVNLWCHDQEVAHAIRTTGINTRYLPLRPLPTHITSFSSLQEALHDTAWVFEALPTLYLRTVLTQAAPYTQPNQLWVVLSKGLDPSSLTLPSNLIEEIIGPRMAPLILAGPSYAKDVSSKQVTGVTLAGKNRKHLHKLSHLLQNDHFLIQFSSDPHGIQIMGAAKNSIALGMGILQGIQVSDNTKALLFMQAISEIKLLIKFFSGKSSTFNAWAGIGDLVLTCYGTQSRNFALGKLLAEGYSLAEASASFTTMPEAISTVQSINKLAELNNLPLPLCKSIYRVTHEQAHPHSIISTLTTMRS
jgi:glycerol-3-phosphate dehydrogenase